MKIIQPSVEIVNPIDYKTMLNTVELAIRNCYQSQDKIEEGSAEKIIKNCLSWNHFSVLEFADVTVKLVTDRAVLSQLSRQRLLSLAVQSQRYCNYAKDRFGRDISFIEPCGLKTDVAKEAWIFSMKEAEAQYFNLIENHKLPAEVARSVLPNSTATTIYAKTNVREWRHIFNLRCDSYAQQDIRWLMNDALTQMFNLYPVFFEDLYIKFVKEAY